MLVVTVCALLCGVDDFVGIEAWANERIDWLRRFLKLGSGIPSHDTFGRLFGLLDRHTVEKGFRRRVGSVLPALADGTVVAIGGKASRRSKMTGRQTLHLVSAFATEAQLILGQEACAEKSNELTAIPVLLEALLLKGAIVNLAIVRRLVLNLFRLDASKRKSGIHTRRILVASSNSYREALLGLDSV